MISVHEKSDNSIGFNELKSSKKGEIAAVVKNQRLPRNVQRRLMRLAQKATARGEKVLHVAIKIRNGSPSRVYTEETYSRIQQIPKKGKPWTYRKKAAAPDPLGAKPGSILASLSRSEIYE